MNQPIPESHRDLFKSKSFAHLATVMPDGTPQVTPVWIDHDGEYILVNTARGRLKDRNMTARPQVGLSILDPQNPYRYLSIRGQVVETIEAGAEAHIDALAHRYYGRGFSFQPGEVRVIYKIAAEHVYAAG